jgi:hypothetical protein
VGNVHTTYRATCSDAAGCDSAVASETDCDALYTSTCLSDRVLAITDYTCSVAVGGGACIPSTTSRICSEPYCVSATATATCVGCSGDRCTGCSVRLCRTTCDPSTGTCR